MTRSSPLRVAVTARAVTPLHGAGGLERSVHDLVVHLAARGVEVTLIAPPARAGATAAAFASADGRIVHRAVPYVTFPFANRRGTTILDRDTAYPIFGWRAGRVALDLVESRAVDVVHGFGASVLGYARARRPGAARRTLAPLVMNPQGLEEFGATAERQAPLKRIAYGPLRAAVRACARAADAIIATDAALEPTVARHLHPREGQMRTIPNGIDVAAADRLAGPDDGARRRAEIGLAPGDALLVSAGRIEFNKGLDVLAAALARAFGPGTAGATAAWRWVVVGDGPFRPALERVIRAAGLDSRVHFTGRVADAELHAWYEAATLFVHPTRYEGSSLVTLEAMAHRRAIVATRAGGLPDKVQPGVNGWLVTPDDPAPLGAAIADALSDSARLAAMGRESRRIVDAGFAWPVLADRHIALYDELLERQ